MAADPTDRDSIKNSDFKANVLVVDGEVRGAERLVASLEEVGHKVIWARDGEAGYNVLDSVEPINVMISELNAHHIDGMRLLQIARKRNPEICVIMITKEPEMELATAAMREGAYDFQTKPLNLARIIAVIERGLSHQKIAGELTELKKRMNHRYGFADIIGGSRGMIRVFDRIKQIADARTTVLISGETGTGKELVAKAIHHNSNRKDRPFVMLNCAALAEGVIESELFGHEKGAFTGAYMQKKGKLEIASGGTLVMDEIGDMPINLQAKLLRALQEKEFYRLGGANPITVDLRIISITNQDLKRLINEERFREDLYYRLVHRTITIPPLRERKEDISALTNFFTLMFCRQANKKISGYSVKAFETLQENHWRGNVRQLENEIRSIVNLTDDGETVSYDILSEEIKEKGGNGDELKKDTREIEVLPRMMSPEQEKAYIIKLLEKHHWNKTRTARELNMTYRGLHKKMQRMGIRKDSRQ